MGLHDYGYKKMFSHPEMVRDFITGFIREDWVKNLDWSTLESAPGSFVSENMRKRETDVIWRVRWKDHQRDGQWLYIYLLIEFQTKVDRFMALRIMTYLGLLWQDLLDKSQIDGMGLNMLPPVLPVVIYRGSRKWTAPTDLSSLIEPAPGKLSQYIPKVDYLPIEERAIDETLLESMTNLAASVFLIEKTQTLEASIRALLNLFDWLEEAKPANDSLKRSILSWFRHVQKSAKLLTDEEFETLTIEGLRPMLADQEEQREKRERELLTRGRKEGEAKVQKELRKLITRLSASGMSVSQISELSDFSEDHIKQLLK